jgi:hypothetical protein
MYDISQTYNHLMKSINDSIIDIKSDGFLLSFDIPKNYVVTLQGIMKPLIDAYPIIVEELIVGFFITTVKYANIPTMFLRDKLLKYIQSSSSIARYFSPKKTFDNNTQTIVTSIAPHEICKINLLTDARSQLDTTIATMIADDIAKAKASKEEQKMRAIADKAKLQQAIEQQRIQKEAAEKLLLEKQEIARQAEFKRIQATIDANTARLVAQEKQREMFRLKEEKQARLAATAVPKSGQSTTKSKKSNLVKQDNVFKRDKNKKKHY